MFTGLIEALGTCRRVEPAGGGRRLVVAAPGWEGVRAGDSVAVNGVCLTVVAVAGEELAFDVVPETLRVTTLGHLRAGDPVNLERALRLGDRLGGHLVQGHVDVVGRIAAREPAGNSLWFRIEAPPEFMAYVVPKGSVAVDGISLTVVECDATGFTVAVIPHTAERTTMGTRRPGDLVNLEADIVAKYARRWTSSAAPLRAAPAVTATGGGDDGRSGLPSGGWGAPRGAEDAGPGGMPVSIGGGPLQAPWAGPGAGGGDGRRPGGDPGDPAAGMADPIEAALADLRAGRMVVVVDDEDREGEGDLVLAAEKVTPEHINFMLREARGLICLALTEQRCRELDLPLMVDPPRDPMETPFTISIDAREGVRTGISAADRARTIRVAVDPASGPGDLVRPGHVFPLRARAGGVLARRGHTEASVDLARLAGLYPAAVICEILRDDGTVARLPDLAAFARRHGLRLVRVADLVRYRLRHERVVRRVAQAKLPTVHGDFQVHAYTFEPTGETHLALVRGSWADEEPVLVRLHSECLTGDALHSLRCDCGQQLDAALEAIAAEGRGVLLYLRQEGRGIGLAAKIRAYELQDGGLDTVEANQALGFPADARDYGVAAQILRDLGVRRVRLLTNNPDKQEQLVEYGLAVSERVPLRVPPHPHNERYLQTKRAKLGHWL
ncbi:MAG TPA: bifunctional 3,4-dihydroxy-2-butanone-4-phosphate synthase/GTP cyclohydrolase II [Thermaerobacter sp.]